MEECNYIEETRKQKKMIELMKDEQDYHIPLILEEFTKERVLTS